MSYIKHSLIALGLITVLGSCSFPLSKKSSDFTSLYISHTKAQVASFREIADTLGYVGTYQTKGSIRALVDIPAILSGAVSTLYDGVIQGYGISQDSQVTFESPSLRYETLLASGGLEAKNVSIISKGGDMYLKYDGIDGADFIDEAMKEVLSRYNATWLALTEENLLETLSGSSEDDKIAYQMSQALGKIRLDDIEMYLTKYPIWKEKKSLGIVDGLSQFEVELSVENILAMVEEFTSKSTGKGLTPEAKTSLETSLKERNIHGVISYDPKNPKIGKVDITIASPDGGSMTMLLVENSDGWNFSSSASGSAVAVSLTDKEDGYALTASISEGGMVMGKISANIVFAGKRFAHFDAVLSSEEEGLTIRLDHNSAEDGTFTGGLNAGIGNLSWNGKIGKEMSLEELHLKGSMIGSNLTLDLIPEEGGLLRGPLVLKSGDEVAIEAKVGLSVNKEELHVLVDIASPETPSIVSRGELHIQGKKEKWSGAIEIPKETTPFSQLSDALSEIEPKDIWMEEPLSEGTEFEDTPLEAGLEDAMTEMSFSGMEITQ